MKNLLLILALVTFTFSVNAQSVSTVNYSKNIIKDKNPDKKLTKFELQLTRGGILRPDISANVYLKENTILRVTSPSLTYNNLVGFATGNRMELNTFLEFRKYVGERNFLSHGPALGFSSNKYEDFDGTYRVNELTAGYNFGVGRRINKHITVGTYINPHISIGSDGVDVLQGRLFAGALSNIYLGYRF
jgi:hypothetical protein